MITLVNLTQIHRNLKSGAIWNPVESLYSQGFPFLIQISAQSSPQSGNLAKTFDFQDVTKNSRFTENPLSPIGREGHLLVGPLIPGRRVLAFTLTGGCS